MLYNTLSTALTMHCMP